MLLLLNSFLFFLGEKQSDRNKNPRGKNRIGRQRDMDYLKLGIHKPVRLLGEKLLRMSFNSIKAIGLILI